MSGASELVERAWRCFHCDDVFTSERCAAAHFGRDESCEPACRIKAGAEGSLVVALRRAEKDAADAWAAIHNETTDSAKAYHAQASRHHEQLRITEELGYERGLADGRELSADELSRLSSAHSEADELARKHLAELAASRAEVVGLREALAKARGALERDRSQVADGLTKIKAALAGRAWLREGRGSYAYDDERYQQEFGHALDEIGAALEPLRIIAGDWTDCPTDFAEITEARTALAGEKPVGAGVETAADETRCRWPVCTCYTAQGPQKCARESLSKSGEKP